MSTGPATPPDGRNARRARTAEQILTVCRDLMKAGQLRPSVEDIAHAAGRSKRNVFDIFLTREALHLEALRDDETQRAVFALILKDSLPPQTEDDRTRFLHAIVLGRA